MQTRQNECVKQPFSMPACSAGSFIFGEFEADVGKLDGRARLGELERKLADEQPSAKVRRTGVFLASKLWELLLASIGSGLLGGVCGYLLRLFQEG